MVSHKKLVSVYLPEELYQALIAYQEKQGFEEASEAIVPILARFFDKGGELKRYATVEQLEALEGKVTDLSKQVAQLCQVITSSTPKEPPRTAIAPSTYGRKFAYHYEQGTLLLSSWFCIRDSMEVNASCQL